MFALRGWLLPAAAQWLNVAGEPVPTDYVLVLPGGVETRPFAAAALVKAGFARQVLVPKTEASPDQLDGIERPEHDVTRQVLELRGVLPSDIIVLNGGSSSTFSDAEALSRFLAKAPARSVSVVTNHYHTRRARWVLSRVLGKRSSDLHFVAVPVDEFNESNWWQVRQGTSAYLGEYFKFTYYLLRYGRAGPIAFVLILLALALCLARRRLRLWLTRKQHQPGS